MLAPAIAKTNLKSYDVPLEDLQSVLRVRSMLRKGA